jgi:hypothetical protein
LDWCAGTAAVLAKGSAGWSVCFCWICGVGVRDECRRVVFRGRSGRNDGGELYGYGDRVGGRRGGEHCGFCDCELRGECGSNAGEAVQDDALDSWGLPF